MLSGIRKEKKRDSGEGSGLGGYLESKDLKNLPGGGECLKGGIQVDKWEEGETERGYSVVLRFRRKNGRVLFGSMGVYRWKTRAKHAPSTGGGGNSTHFPIQKEEETF